jgi:hypothetical protein
MTRRAPPTARAGARLLALLLALPAGVHAADAPPAEPAPAAGAPAPAPAPGTGTPAPEDAAPEGAAPKGAPADAPDTSLEGFRTPVDALAERMLGATSRAVRFDWRRSPVAVGLVGSELLERNNFGSTRWGVVARKALGGFLGEVALTRVRTWGTESSRLLALTPYRQAGRPGRWELDVNLGMPLAEGVATPLPGFLPTAELVLSANAGVRYLFYPESLRGMDFGTASRALLTPQLSEAEERNLEAVRLPGMKVDRQRFGLLVGGSLDVYLQPGVFLSPRAMLGVPLLAGRDGRSVGWWWELSAAAGWAF